MKKILSILAASLFMFGCSNTDFYESPEQLIVDNYNGKFVGAFGEPAKTQTWGFGSTITRGTNSSFTKWQSDRNWDNMPENPVSQDEINYVLQYIADHPNEGGTESDLTNYYIQNIGSSKDQYHLNFIDDNGNVHHSTDITGGNQMDYLVINGLHINDYNATTGSFGLAENLPLINITYHDSYANLIIENAYKFYYIEYNGKVNMYLCFDYRTSKQDNGQLTFNGDGVYNDWVVKISPADGRSFTPNEVNYIGLIVGEDLSVNSSSDWDFNDVVFAVGYKGNETWIKILAAGGQLPLYVEGIEIHEALEVEVTDMVNTGLMEADSVELKISDTKLTPAEIKVAVYKQNNIIELMAPQGEPAAKLFIPDVNYKWCNERKDIRTIYPKFKTWVNTNTPEIWWD